jgi:hypothetical protein
LLAQSCKILINKWYFRKGKKVDCNQSNHWQSMAIFDNHWQSMTITSFLKHIFPKMIVFSIINVIILWCWDVLGSREFWFAEPTDQHKVKNDFHFQAFTSGISKFYCVLQHKRRFHRKLIMKTSFCFCCSRSLHR